MDDKKVGGRKKSDPAMKALPPDAPATPAAPQGKKRSAPPSSAGSGPATTGPAAAPPPAAPPNSPARVPDGHHGVEPPVRLAVFVTEVMTVLAVLGVLVVLIRKDFSEVARFQIVMGLLGTLVAMVFGLLGVTLAAGRKPPSTAHSSTAHSSTGHPSTTPEPTASIHWTSPCKTTTVTVVGAPAVMLIVFLYLTRSAASEIASKPPMAPEQFFKDREALDRQEGWIPYSEWRTAKCIGDCTNWYSNDKEAFSKMMMLNKVFPTDSDRANAKLPQATIETLLLYFRNAAEVDPATGLGKRRFLKIQRIRGRANDRQIEMFFTATSTFAGSPRFALFHREDGQVEGFSNYRPGDFQRGDQWAPLGSLEEVDCIVLSFYPDDSDEPADDFWVDTGRYCHQGTVSLAVLSEEPFKGGAAAPKCSYWTVKPAVYGQPNGLPILFKPVSTGVDTGPNAGKEMIAGLRTWMEDLDRYSEDNCPPGRPELKPDASAAVLQLIQREFPTIQGGKVRKFSHLLDADKTPWKNRLAFGELQTSGPVAAVYAWKKTSE